MRSEKSIGPLWLLQFFADFCAVVAAYYTTLLLRFHSESGFAFFTFVNRLLGVRETGALADMFEDFYVISAPRIVVLLMATLAILYALNNLYPGRRYIRRRPEAWSILIANATALVLFYSYFYLRRNVFHPRSFLGTVILLNTVFCVGFRALLESMLGAARSRLGMGRCRAVLLGDNEDADWIRRLIDATHPHGIEIVAHLRFRAGEPFEQQMCGIEAAVRREAADMIVSADTSLPIGQVMRLLERAESPGVCVKVLSNQMDVLTRDAHLAMDMIHGVPLAHFDPPPTPWFPWLHRRFSVALAALVLISLLPFLAVCALLIKLTSRGPVFFVQERMGVNRKPFRMFKFRTMYDRAEEALSQVEEFNEAGQALFKIRKDPRITPIGRFLRRFSLDELPQLINVIRGEMSLVGPRPLPRRDFESYYEEWHYSRHAGMPGLTCLWQVSGRSDVDFHNMCILDVYYLRNRSWVLDLRIVLKTFWVVLFGRGAY